MNEAVKQRLRQLDQVMVKAAEEREQGLMTEEEFDDLDLATWHMAQTLRDLT